MLNSEEIKPVATAIIELRLSEGISKGGRESVHGGQATYLLLNW